MSTKVGHGSHDLNDCGCCEGLAVETPVEVTNRPGLSAVAYRVGTHPQFRRTLVARLSDASHPALRALTTRDADDFTLALLDAWATTADVLTFYQERIANESYLRTATERVSILELARLVGYELRPGVAASTYLAFTMSEVPGATRETAEALGVPSATVIDSGIKVQSIPGPEEKAQTFETVEKIEARVEWNAIRPRLTRPQEIKTDAGVVYLAGLATGLKKGDGLLITPVAAGAAFRQVAEVTAESELGRTKVRLQPQVMPVATTVPMSINVIAAFGVATKKYLGTTVNATALHADSVISRFRVRDVFKNLFAGKSPQPGVLALRARASIFGHNAPKWGALPVSQRIGEIGPDKLLYSGPYTGRENSWAEQSLDNYWGVPNNKAHVFLDNTYPSIARDSWVVLKDEDEARAYQVTGVTEVSKSDFTLSAKVTRLTLSSRADWDKLFIRTTTVHAQSEELEMARLPEETPVEGSEIDLDTWVDGLAAGQKLIVCGELQTESGVTACELATIKKVEQVMATDGFTRVHLTTPLDNSYVRATVTISANVALATHGETVRETLGSGDASRAYQRFTLRQPPLTYVSASAPSGTQTTLEVRVAGLLWHEVPTLYGRGPEERVYVARQDDEGRTTVQFGDGRTGARLPTGQDNVTAVYRKGTGLAGLLKADQLSQLMTRPLGLKGATNPMGPAGAADPESRDQARRNATLTLHTLDRIVSLLDYEDFARAFMGVARALATWTWNGETRGVFVTVAGPNGAGITDDSPLHANLLAAMRAAGDPAVPLLVKSFEQRFFRLRAKVKVHGDYLDEAVLKEVESRLRQKFSFDAREFGQPVTLSEVIAVVQGAAGVVAVDVDELYRTDEAVTPALHARLPAAQPLAGTGKVFAAEMLTLEPGPLDIKVMS
ncbi:MAG TPA: putative baseplate assembly protein [Pyrinomonadaceae bacterium]|nr:putative baseplate assembly protein [Pyrinomonadaceae bacterium]